MIQHELNRIFKRSFLIVSVQALLMLSIGYQSPFQKCLEQRTEVGDCTHLQIHEHGKVVPKNELNKQFSNNFKGNKKNILKKTVGTIAHENNFHRAYKISGKF